MHLKILKNGHENNLCRPQKSGDVGWDLICVSMKIVGSRADGIFNGVPDLFADWHSINFIEYETGIAIEPFYVDYIGTQTVQNVPDFTKYTKIHPRSSISKYNLSLCNAPATVDPNYRDTIKCRFNYLWQPEDLVATEAGITGRINSEKIYKPGDRVAQLVFDDTVHPEIMYADELSPTDRNLGGFGSTGS